MRRMYCSYDKGVHIMSITRCSCPIGAVCSCGYIAEQERLEADPVTGDFVKKIRNLESLNQYYVGQMGSLECQLLASKKAECDAKAAVEAQAYVIRALVTVVKGECCKHIVPDLCCNNDPDRQNCEGHMAEAKDVVIALAAKAAP